MSSHSTSTFFCSYQKGFRRSSALYHAFSRRLELAIVAHGKKGSEALKTILILKQNNWTKNVKQRTLGLKGNIRRVRCVQCSLRKQTQIKEKFQKRSNTQP